jgi:hypothetical protein
LGVKVAILWFILALVHGGIVVGILTGAKLIRLLVGIPRAIAPILGFGVEFGIGVTSIGMHRLRIRRGRFGLVSHRLHDGAIFFVVGGIGWEWEQAHAQRIKKI